MLTEKAIFECSVVLNECERLTSLCVNHGARLVYGLPSVIAPVAGSCVILTHLSRPNTSTASETPFPNMVPTSMNEACGLPWYAVWNSPIVVICFFHGNV